MARSVNKVILLGNLTRDPELRYTPQGHAVCTFGLATNREWVTDGERQESAEFHNIVAWNKLAELCSQLLGKGSKAYVEGRIQSRSWDAEDGQKRYRTEVVIDEMIVLTPRSGSVALPTAGEESQAVVEEPEGPGASEGKDVPSDEEVTSKDVPF